MNPKERSERFLGDSITALSSREVPKSVQKPLHLLEQISQKTIRRIGRNRFGRNFLLLSTAAATAVSGLAVSRASADSPTIDQTLATLNAPRETVLGPNASKVQPDAMDVEEISGDFYFVGRRPYSVVQGIDRELYVAKRDATGVYGEMKPVAPTNFNVQTIDFKGEKGILGGGVAPGSNGPILKVTKDGGITQTSVDLSVVGINSEMIVGSLIVPGSDKALFNQLNGYPAIWDFNSESLIPANGNITGLAVGEGLFIGNTDNPDIKNFYATTANGFVASAININSGYVPSYQEYSLGVSLAGIAGKVNSTNGKVDLIYSPTAVGGRVLEFTPNGQIIKDNLISSLADGYNGCSNGSTRIRSILPLNNSRLLLGGGCTFSNGVQRAVEILVAMDNLTTPLAIRMPYPEEFNSISEQKDMRVETINGHQVPFAFFKVGVDVVKVDTERNTIEPGDIFPVSGVEDNPQFPDLTTPTHTPTVTATWSSTNTPSATVTEAPATLTNTPTKTSTPMPAPTNTPTNTAMPVLTSTPTGTPRVEPSATPTTRLGAQDTPEATFTSTSTPAATSTATETVVTNTPVATETPKPAFTVIPLPKSVLMPFLGKVADREMQPGW